MQCDGCDLPPCPILHVNVFQNPDNEFEIKNEAESFSPKIDEKFALGCQPQCSYSAY